MYFLFEKFILFWSKKTFFKKNKEQKNALKRQKQTFGFLIKKGKSTLFGKNHFFYKIKNYSDFKKNVPLRVYEDFSFYIKKISFGEKNVLWPGRPLYFCETSGTTSGKKYIPLTKNSLRTQIVCMRDALFSYVYRTKNASCLSGFWIFLQGSPVLNKKNKIKTGRLSGIVALHVPFYLKSRRLPSFKTNSIEDWETKLDKITKETINKNMTAVAGIPPWLIMYFEKIKKIKNKRIKEVFPNLSLLVYGGVNYLPYEKKINSLLGSNVDSLEIFPASEGFFAYQNDEKGGLFLCFNNNIFYEFIKTEDLVTSPEKRVCLENVELKTNYALIVNSSAGLWGYLIGDTVEFVSLSPYKIIITGRIKHFCSAFGEHLIIKEIERAIKEAEFVYDDIIEDFHLYPEIKGSSKGRHVCIVEGENKNKSLLEKSIQASLMKQNSYYNDLIKGNVIYDLKVVFVKKGTFNKFLKKNNRLGGQNKPQRISNDGVFAKQILLINDEK